MIYRVLAENITKELIDKINAVANKCNEHDKMIHSFFFDDEDDVVSNLPAIYYAANSDNEITAFISLYKIDDSYFEACGFVLPECRNSGLFSMLLDEVFEDYESIDISFPVCQHNLTAKSILSHYEAELVSTECKMAFSLDNYIVRDTMLMLEAINLTGTMYQYNFYADSTLVNSDLANRTQGEVIGTILVTLSKDYATISDVTIKEEYRGTGLGTPMINSLLNKLYSLGCNKVILHVTKSNVPAYRLYASTGFIIESGIDYYCI